MKRYLRKTEAQVYVIGTREPTMFLQETYIGSLHYTFQVRFRCDAEYATTHKHRYQSPLFELPQARKKRWPRKVHPLIY
ncbi:hypothetical protein NV377_25605 [Paenibacillus sp. T3-5-0-4]|nr:hypothetical protein [Paenibacillus endoradicis]